MCLHLAALIGPRGVRLSVQLLPLSILLSSAHAQGGGGGGDEREGVWWGGGERRDEGYVR